MKLGSEIDLWSTQGWWWWWWGGYLFLTSFLTNYQRLGAEMSKQWSTEWSLEFTDRSPRMLHNLHSKKKPEIDWDSKTHHASQVSALAHERLVQYQLFLRPSRCSGTSAREGNRNRLNCHESRDPCGLSHLTPTFYTVSSCFPSCSAPPPLPFTLFANLT